MNDAGFIFEMSEVFESGRILFVLFSHKDERGVDFAASF
jgi:hypothetical protein